jgi:dipeptidyl aminopeptidase/acylaminoacyl peptidase
MSQAARRRLSRRGFLASAGAFAGVDMLAGGSASAAPQAAAQQREGQAGRPYRIDDFFTYAGTRSVKLSPDGKRIASLEQIGTLKDPHGVVDILDASDPEGTPARVDLGPIEVDGLYWGNDHRLLVRLIITQTIGRSTNSGSHLRGGGGELKSRRIVSIDVDTGARVTLFEAERSRARGNLDLGQIVDLLPNDADHILMTALEPGGFLALHRVSLIDGSAERLERGNAGTFGWDTKDGAAVLRHDINSRGTLESVYARAPGESDWRFVRRTRVQDAPDFSWIGGTEKPGVVLVTARAGEEDVESVRELDLRTLGFGVAMQARAGRDVLYGLKDSAGLYLGAAYYGDRLEYDFVEPALVPHHRALNRFFDNDCDVYLTDVDASRNRFIARVVGPREPGGWYFYDRTARNIVNIGSRLKLDADRLGPAELLKVQTRDGATVEAYLTAPPGGRPGPLVVLAHGGPELRDDRGWDRQVQILASQGWWVIQPNFRGSGGYGLAYAREGWHRWGTRMQEDVEDSVAQAIALKGLDRDRVAIMGSSYGGYAAMMGAVKTPALYKAAISIAGVSDLPDMLAWEKREDETPGQEIYDFWTKRIGAPGTDDAMLEAASPRRRAAEITCPVFLVHGTDDYIVPVEQTRRLNAALRGAGKKVEFIEVNDAGHGDWEDDKEQELLGRYIGLLKTAFA